jgi:hypothetical protein
MIASEKKFKDPGLAKPVRAEFLQQVLKPIETKQQEAGIDAKLIFP